MATRISSLTTKETRDKLNQMVAPMKPKYQPKTIEQPSLTEQAVKEVIKNNTNKEAFTEEKQSKELLSQAINMFK